MKTLDEIEGAFLNDAKVKKPNTDQKSNEKEKKSIKKMLTKVVIRRLPPLMTEEEFIKQTDPLPDHDYLYFVPADWSLGQHASSRAYINFVRHEDIFLFKDKFDGYVFVDNKGVEHPAVVEFAPFQGLPKNKSRKKDKKCNTIDKDQHFINFLASLANEENETNKPEMKMEYSFQLKDDKKITSTPLLEFLANRKLESREERRRKSVDKKKHREEEKNQKKDQQQQQQSRSDDNNSSRGGRDRRKRDAMKSKNKVSYPPPIPEEDNNDGIIVRTVKSRLGNNTNDRKRDRTFESKQKHQNQPSNKNNTFVADTQSKPIAKDDHNDREKERKPSMDNNDQRRAANAQRESNRRKERKLRKIERENNRKDGGNGGGGGGNSGSTNSNNKESEKTEESNKQDSGAPQAPLSKSVESNQPQREEKVRKYSESRRDRRSARSENKSSAELNQIKTKNDLAKTTTKPQMTNQSNIQTEENKTLKSAEQQDDATDVKTQRRQSIDSNKNDSGSGGDNSRDNSKAKQEEREHLGRIRNKDRPSLQIYQPGKRRPTGSSKDDKTNPNSPTERMAKTPEFETNIEMIENSLSKIEGKILPKEEKNEKIPVVKVDKQQPAAASPPVAVAGASLAQTLPPTTEKRVSRYSERRNRNKERLSKRDDNQKSNCTGGSVGSVTDVDNNVENTSEEIEHGSVQLDNNNE